ncbi:MAG: hypothetical protein B5M51_00885, partial [Anaerolinea sp. 4484_236]
FNALSLKLSRYDDKVGDFSFASWKNSVFAVEPFIFTTMILSNYNDSILLSIKDFLCELCVLRGKKSC